MIQTSEKRALEYLESARSTMESAGYDDFRPMVHMHKDGYPDIICEVLGHPQGIDEEAVKVIVSGLCSQTPDSVAVIADGVIDLSPHSEGDEPLMPGELYEKFKQGCMSVSEVLIVHYLTKEDSVIAVQPYRWTPVDGWEWDEPVVRDGKDSVIRLVNSTGWNNLLGE